MIGTEVCGTLVKMLLLFGGRCRVHPLTVVARCVLSEISSVVVLMLCLSEVHAGEASLGCGSVLNEALYRSFRFDELWPTEHIIGLTFLCLSRGIPSNFSALRGGRTESHPSDVVRGCAA